MLPLFDRNVELIGWLQDTRNVWNLGLNWVAWVDDGNVFSTTTHGWCGPLNGTSCCDREGRVVAWNPEQGPVGTMPPFAPPAPLVPLTPLTPLMPLMPLTPLVPLTPMSGWSSLSFEQWLQAT